MDDLTCFIFFLIVLAWFVQLMYSFHVSNCDGCRDDDGEDYAFFAPQKDITPYELAVIVELKEFWISKEVYNVLKLSGIHRHFHVAEV
jgi:hypothetical protein